MIKVGQSPLSRMKRSNIATYIEVFTPIRTIYAKQEVAKEKGLLLSIFPLIQWAGVAKTAKD